MQDAPSSSPRIDALINSIRELRDQVVNHDVCARLTTIEHLRTFMEHHVFAVWDFMSLLKVLQARLTCVTVPWTPSPESLSRRLINEIVLEEESDEVSAGEYLSHFEMYRRAMQQCGADTSIIDGFVSEVRRGATLDAALHAAGTSKAAADFVRTTWRFVESGSTHTIAAAFTFGREDLIPDMFRSLVRELAKQYPEQLSLFRDYIERHINLDEEHHAPMARKMIVALCQDDPEKWRECESAARDALEARVSLWDSVRQNLVSGANPSSTMKIPATPAETPMFPPGPSSV